MKERLNGLSFIQIEEKFKRTELDSLLLRGAAICGCNIPATEFFAEVIMDAISDFILNFEYGDLTIGEIILAMQMNATGELHFENDIIPFHGNTLNINFLASVLKRYMASRNLLEGKIKNKIDGNEY